MNKKSITFILLYVVAACSNNPPEYKLNIVNKVTKNEFNDIVPMAGKETVALKGNGNMYYMPLGKDNDGCTYYNSFAPGKVTLTAVYYKKPDGGYTNLQSEADCMAGK
jgi:hypothetical protein